jgi:hypothetical protein
MKRAQIVVDEALLRKAQARAKRLHSSFSAVVREALAAYLTNEQPDLAWVGCLKEQTNPHASDDWKAVRRDIEQGMSKQRGRL